MMMPMISINSYRRRYQTMRKKMLSELQTMRLLKSKMMKYLKTFHRYKMRKGSIDIKWKNKSPLF